MPSDQTQAVQFAIALDSRWAQFRADLENNNKSVPGFSYPENLLVMYDLAANYQVVSSSGIPVNVGAFVANLKVEKGKVSKAAKAKQDEDKPKAEQNAGGRKTNKPRRLNQRDCRLCGAKAPTHWIEDCDYWQQCQEVVSKAKAASAETHLTFSRGTLSEDGVILHIHAIPDSDEDAITTVEIALPASASELDKFDVLLDNQASHSLFCNPSLLHSIRKAPQPGSVQGASHN
jgi:hypothetical protein